MGSSQHASRCRDGAWRVPRRSAASGPKVRRNPPQLKATPRWRHLKGSTGPGASRMREAFSSVSYREAEHFVEGQECAEGAVTAVR